MAKALKKKTPTALASTAQLKAKARKFIAAAKADNTREAYRHDWRAFQAWCRAQGLDALPADGDTVALYVTHMATEPYRERKVSTIQRALAAISQAHKAAGLDSPRGTAPVRAVMQGLKREQGIAPAQKAPLSVAELRTMVEALPATPLGKRDRALLLLGFAGAFRRSELVALNVGDVAFTEDGAEVVIRRSKTDSEGAGAKVGIPFGSDKATCPVRALRAWLRAAKIKDGAIFVSFQHGEATGRRLLGRDVARVVKRSAKRIGLNRKLYAGHSLRAGLATAAAKAGKSERVIMAQGRWRSVTTARRYIRDGCLFTDNAASGIGL